MNKIVGALFVGFVGFASLAQAQEAVEPIDLMKRAVEYATKADAYSAYCSEEPSSMASDYLDKFYLDESVTIAQKDELASVMEKEVQAFVEKLRKDTPSCDDLEFMMGRLEAMRKLKDVSYLLNGVDPATLPKDNIPELEELMLHRDTEGSMPVEQ
jgi:hypothetical protein